MFPLLKPVESMLETNKTTALLSVVAIALGIAVIFPGSTYKFLTGPANAIQVHLSGQERQLPNTELQKQPSLDEWHVTVRHLHGDDAVAGIRYGLEKDGRSISDWTGKEYDQNEIRQMIRKAADHGNLGAKYAVWNMDGSSKEGLLEIGEYVRTKDRSPETLVYLSEVMIWQATLTCDEDLFDRGVEAERLGGDAISQLERYSLLTSAKQSYLKECQS